MQYLKKIISGISLIVFVLSISACSSDLNNSDTIDNSSNNFSPEIQFFRLSEEDLLIETDDYREINLNNIYGDCNISEGGAYLLTGTLNGTIYIDTIDQNVHLYLNGVEIDGVDGSAINVISAGKLFITSMQNTDNYLSDGGAYDSNEISDACIYAECDVTINGEGALIVSGLYKDAIHCKDIVKITGSNFSFQAKRDAVRGNDGVLLLGSNIKIEAERNGVRTTKSNVDNRGTVEISGEEISIIGGEYGVLSTNHMYIHDASCYIKGVISDFLVEGDMIMEEGCLVDE